MDLSGRGNSDSSLFAAWSLVAARFERQTCTDVALCLRGETWLGTLWRFLALCAPGLSELQPPAASSYRGPTEAMRRKEGVPCLLTFSFFLRAWGRVGSRERLRPLVEFCYVQWTAFFLKSLAFSWRNTWWLSLCYVERSTLPTRLNCSWDWGMNQANRSFLLIDNWVGTQTTEIWEMSLRFIWQWVWIYAITHLETPRLFQKIITRTLPPLIWVTNKQISHPSPT